MRFASLNLEVNLPNRADIGGCEARYCELRKCQSWSGQGEILDCAVAVETRSPDTVPAAPARLEIFFVR